MTTPDGDRGVGNRCLLQKDVRGVLKIGAASAAQVNPEGGVSGVFNQGGCRAPFQNDKCPARLRLNPDTISLSIHNQQKLQQRLRLI